MINDESSFKHSGLCALWKDPKKNPPNLNSTMIKRCRLLLSHLETATSFKDIAEGFGETKNFHKLEPSTAQRYSLDVNGNYRVTFRIVNDKTGEVDGIDLEDTH